VFGKEVTRFDFCGFSPSKFLERFGVKSSSTAAVEVAAAAKVEAAAGAAAAIRAVSVAVGK